MITLFALLSGICLLIALLGEYMDYQRVCRMAQNFKEKQ